MSFKVKTDAVLAMIRNDYEGDVKAVSGKDGRIGTREREKIHPNRPVLLRGTVEMFGKKSPSEGQVLDRLQGRFAAMIATENKTGPEFLSAREVDKLEKRYGAAARPIADAYEVIAALKGQRGTRDV